MVGCSHNRRIVEMHGGEIWAEFSEGGGGGFTVKLPREAGKRGGIAQWKTPRYHNR